jgi:hypothetical protein
MAQPHAEAAQLERLDGKAGQKTPGKIAKFEAYDRNTHFAGKSEERHSGRPALQPGHCRCTYAQGNKNKYLEESPGYCAGKKSCRYENFHFEGSRLMNFGLAMLRQAETASLPVAHS